MLHEVNDMHEIFPREVTSNVPRITLTGAELLHVEQHQGLMGCTREEVSLRTACGVLTVPGGNLTLRQYSAVEAVVSGDITGISMQREGRLR